MQSVGLLKIVTQGVLENDHIYIYIYILEFDLSLYRDICFWNPKVNSQSSIVDTISKLRHYVGIR